MQKTILNFLWILIALAAFTIAPHPVRAYTVSPLVIDHQVKQRDILYDTITVNNDSDQIARLYPTVNEVSVDAGGTIQNFLEPSMSDTSLSITSWLEISRARLEIPPHSTKEITLTTRISPTAQPGEYHALVSFPSGSNRPEAESHIRQGGVPGVIVRIGIAQEENQFLRLDKFVVERFVKSNLEGQISYTLTNPGESAVVPKGEIIIYDNRGNEVGSAAVNQDAKSIDAGKTETFTADVPKGLRLGKYKAYLSVEYGLQQNESLHDTAFFYVIPLRELAIIFAIVLGAAIGLALFVHRKFDMGPDEEGVHNIALYVRESRSEEKEHDIDLNKKITD